MRTKDIIKFYQSLQTFKISISNKEIINLTYGNDINKNNNKSNTNISVNDNVSNLKTDKTRKLIKKLY